MVKCHDRREMYNPLKVLCGVLCAAFIAPAVANVATTAGSNLTAYNGTGATSNNQWNSLMNGRGGMGTTPAEANFGNCNAVILRCATPKCSSGGCVDMSVARPIVTGCVNSNNSCKKYGDELIDYITAQIVAQSTAKVQEQQNAVAIAQAQAEAQAAAAAAAAEQNNAQVQQMQSQMAAMQAQMAESMAAMQEQMAAQSESQNAQIQNALAEQRASYASTGETGAMIEGLEGLGVAEQLAAKNGVSADILVREQISGQIETSIDDAVLALKDLKGKLDAVLEYAGCDSAANGCTGPKRVKKFKDLANDFFDPYENVVENMYDALILAMTVGIDVSDVIMLLSNSCNMWGKYMCDTCSKTIKDRQTAEDIAKDGACECYDKEERNCYYRVLTNKGKVSKDQTHCRLVSIINQGEEVQREWVDANSGMTGATQVACASDVVMNVPLFRGMKKKATLDIETLRGLVNQDAYTSCRTRDKNKTEFDITQDCGANFCMVNPVESKERWKKLRNAVDTKKLGKYCYKSEKAMGQDGEDIAMSIITFGEGLNNTDLVSAVNRIAVPCEDRKEEDICKAKLSCEWLPVMKKCVLKAEAAPIQTLQFKNTGLLSSTNTGSGLLPSSLGSSSLGTDQRAPGTSINYNAATKGFGTGIGK